MMDCCSMASLPMAIASFAAALSFVLSAKSAIRPISEFSPGFMRSFFLNLACTSDSFLPISFTYPLIEKSPDVASLTLRLNVLTLFMASHLCPDLEFLILPVEMLAMRDMPSVIPAQAS